MTFERTTESRAAGDGMVDNASHEVDGCRESHSSKRVKTRIVVRSNGTVTLETTGRGKDVQQARYSMTSSAWQVGRGTWQF